MYDKQSIDKYFLITVILLLSFGVVMVYTASAALSFEKFGDHHYFLRQHLLKVFGGFLLLIAGMKIDYHWYRNKAPILIAVSFALLIFLLISGEVQKIKGANRWIGIAGFGFQPSVLAKLALIIYTARYLDKKADRIKDFANGLLPVLIVLAIFCLLITLQPNFSTALVITIIVFTMLFVGGISMKHIGFLGLINLPIILSLIVFSPYRMGRILSHLGLSNDIQGLDYQINQSLISFGSGGLFGVGLGESKQKLFFLPEPFTDFIYSIIGEEFGFIGTALVLAAFLFMLFRGIRIIKNSPDRYGFYLSTGLLFSIILYAIINAGVAVGLFPTTGLPMPFISYGGSSIFYCCFAAGVLLNISSQKPPAPRVEGLYDGASEDTTVPTLQATSAVDPTTRHRDREQRIESSGF